MGCPLSDSGANVSACGDRFLCRSMIFNIREVFKLIVSAAFDSDATIMQRENFILGRKSLPLSIIPSMKGSVISVGRYCEGLQFPQNCVIFTKDEYIIPDLERVKDRLVKISESDAVWRPDRSQNYLYPIDLSGSFNKSILKPGISYHCAKGNDYWRFYKSLNH